jgi:peptide/nickel transport system ATP-binding protein
VKLPEPERIYASYPHQLSGGQRQRIMIAMALVLDPVLLIADEPTTALDVTTQAADPEADPRPAGGQGTGVLFITHDFGVVAEIADRVAVLRWGELVEMGRPTDPARADHGIYTKMLISSVPSILVPRARRAARRRHRAAHRQARQDLLANALSAEVREVKAATDVDARHAQAARRSASSANRAPASRRWRAASPA